MPEKQKGRNGVSTPLFFCFSRRTLPLTLHTYMKTLTNACTLLCSIKDTSGCESFAPC